MDSTLYLRTYEVVDGLEGGVSRRWWEKMLRKAPPAEPLAARGKKPVVAVPASAVAQEAPEPASTALEPEWVQPAPRQDFEWTQPVPAYGPVVITVEPELALVPTARPDFASYSAQPTFQGKGTRRLSWFWLALLAVVSACLTFVLIDVAWSFSHQPAPVQAPRASHYVRTFSPSQPRFGRL